MGRLLGAELHFVSLSQTSADSGFLARHVGLKCGVAVSTPALTVNRLCGSGFQSIVNAAHVSVIDTNFYHSLKN